MKLVEPQPKPKTPLWRKILAIIAVIIVLELFLWIYPMENWLGQPTTQQYRYAAGITYIQSQDNQPIENIWIQIPAPHINGEPIVGENMVLTPATATAGLDTRAESPVYLVWCDVLSQGENIVLEVDFLAAGDVTLRYFGEDWPTIRFVVSENVNVLFGVMAGIQGVYGYEELWQFGDYVTGDEVFGMSLAE